MVQVREVSKEWLARLVPMLVPPLLVGLVVLAQPVHLAQARSIVPRRFPSVEVLMVVNPEPFVQVEQEPV
jgi:hypothetical protein